MDRSPTNHIVYHQPLACRYNSFLNFRNWPSAPGIGFPIGVRGTAFQQRVWDALDEIPVGETVSYTEIAQRIGSQKAVRAVAGACAANNLAVVIPCHRVVRSDGSLSGYAGGVERNREASQKP